MHIRLGDYLIHDQDSTDGFSITLPQEYYVNALRLMLENFPDGCRVFVASDDIEQAKVMLNDFQKIIFIDESAEKTLSILSTCDAGILSASSFSWWAAHYAILNLEKSGPFIAPKFWLGYATKQWNPNKFDSQFLTYIDVI